MRSLLQTALGTIPALRRHPDDESALLTRMAAPLLRSRRLQIGVARLDVPDFLPSVAVADPPGARV